MGSDEMTINNAAYVNNLVNLLLDKEGSIFAIHRCKLTAKEQRELFGQYLGKGTIIINGTEETIIHRVKVAYGNDWDDTSRLQWKDL
jgi:hypothetical protein